MRQYLDLVREVLNNGTWKDPSRPGLPPTKEIFGAQMKFIDVGSNFPLLTTKKLSIKNILVELTWFLKGRTDLQYLHDRGCHIWDQDALRYYKSMGFPVDTVADIYDYSIDGDLGAIYGKQWRSWGEDRFDQIDHVIKSIKGNPNSRYHLVTSWNPSLFLHYSDMAALPSCHMFFQFSVRENKYLDLLVYQRSADLMLGVPYNLASYAALLIVVSKLTSYEPGDMTWMAGSVHIYNNHIESAILQSRREPRLLPKLSLNKPLASITSLMGLEYSDFELTGYDPYPFLPFELNVGY